MTNLITKLKSAAAHVVLLAVAIVVAGLGFAFMGTLALFGLIALGAAIVTWPFVVRTTRAPANTDFVA